MGARVSGDAKKQISDHNYRNQKGQSVTHHSGEAGDERDAVLHFLLGDLHRCAVLLLQRKRVCSVLSHPWVQLNPPKYCDTSATPTIHTCTYIYMYICEATLISGMVILVSGFLSSILSMSCFNFSPITGLRGKLYFCCSTWLHLRLTFTN